MTGYVRKFEGNTAMSFMINNMQLLKRYNQIWKKVEKLASQFMVMIINIRKQKQKYLMIV